MFNMKISLILSVLLVGIVMAGSIEDDEKAWEDFKVKFHKVYLTADEEAKRKVIFLENKHKIDEHNKRYKKGEEKIEATIDENTDYTIEELAYILRGIILPEMKVEQASEAKRE